MEEHYVEWLVTGLGVVVVILVVRDVFHTLFHPTGDGGLARLVMRAVWWATRSRFSRRRLSSLSGPLGMVLVVVVWGVLTTFGWTLIYAAHMPDGFSFAPSLEPGGRGSVVDSLYLSLVTVATLGFGDIVPTSPVLRLVAPLEALFGFFLLTAAVSWVLETYPALTRRRVLALRLSALRRAHPDRGYPVAQVVPSGVLFDLAGGIAQVRVDFTQYTAIYYFRDDDPAVALPEVLGFAAELARTAASSPDPATRLAGWTLARALDDLAETLAGKFLRAGGSTEAVLRAYAEDQRCAGR
ncbi:potassium channel family protein [Actinosynnema sp. CA-248983]